MIAKIKQIICISLVLFTFSAQAQKLVLAAERTDVYLNHLQNKKVGVVGNQTSMIANTHLVDSLLSLGIDVVKVFSQLHSNSSCISVIILYQIPQLQIVSGSITIL